MVSPDRQGYIVATPTRGVVRKIQEYDASRPPYISPRALNRGPVRTSQAAALILVSTHNGHLAPPTGNQTPFRGLPLPPSDGSTLRAVGRTLEEFKTTLGKSFVRSSISDLMPRLSALPRPRDSVFAGSHELFRGDANAVCPPNLRECVLAMEDCCEEAYEAQQLLRNGTYDLPRMSKVLQNQRVFLLIDEGTVRRYKADLADEIEPQINELIERAEKGVKALGRRQALIQSKVEAAQATQSRTATAPTANKREERRAQMLSKQRQRLEEEIKILESELLALQTKKPSRS